MLFHLDIKCEAGMVTECQQNRSDFITNNLLPSNKNHLQQISFKHCKKLDRENLQFISQSVTVDDWHLRQFANNDSHEPLPKNNGSEINIKRMSYLLPYNEHTNQCEYTDFDLYEALSVLEENEKVNSKENTCYSSISKEDDCEHYYLPMLPKYNYSDSGMLFLDNKDKCFYEKEENPYIEMTKAEKRSKMDFSLLNTLKNEHEPLYMELTIQNQVRSHTKLHFSNSDKKEKLKIQKKETEMKPKMPKEGIKRLSLSDNFRPASYYLALEKQKEINFSLLENSYKLKSEETTRELRKNNLLKNLVENGDTVPSGDNLITDTFVSDDEITNDHMDFSESFFNADSKNDHLNLLGEQPIRPPDLYCNDIEHKVNYTILKKLDATKENLFDYSPSSVGSFNSQYNDESSNYLKDLETKITELNISAPYYYSDLKRTTSDRELNNMKAIDFTKASNIFHINNHLSLKSKNQSCLEKKNLGDKHILEVSGTKYSKINNINESITTKKNKKTPIKMNSCLVICDKKNHFCMGQSCFSPIIKDISNAEHQWEEDSIWRENLRKVSHRHAISLDELNLVGSHARSLSLDRSFLSIAKDNKKIERDLIYENYKVVKNPNNVANVKRNLRNDDLKDDDDVYVQLAQNDESTIYETLRETDPLRNSFPVDRENIRQWDLMSSGLMKLENKKSIVKK